jgi:hypothetical protein
MQISLFKNHKIKVVCQCGRTNWLEEWQVTTLALRLSIPPSEVDFSTLCSNAQLFKCDLCKRNKPTFYLYNRIEVAPASLYRSAPSIKSARKRKKGKRKGVQGSGSRAPIARKPGCCIRCGDPIPDERLRIVPGARLCTGCQRAEELR